MNSHLDAYHDLDDLRDEGSLVHLDVDQCLERLARDHVGRLAVNDPAGPLVFPVNYLVDGGTILFRTTVGSKLAAADEHERVAFQVDHIDRDSQTGWSVLVRGRLIEVTRPDEIDRLQDLALTPFAGGDRTHFVRVMPASITGRSTHALDASPSSDAPPQADATQAGSTGTEGAEPEPPEPVAGDDVAREDVAGSEPPSAWTPSSPRPPHPPRRTRPGD